jgi:ribosomal protein S18 acetylase RimI-like enzyme
VLLFRGFLHPVLTVLGPPAAAAPLWREALAEIPRAEQVFAVCLPEHRAFVDAATPFAEPHAMFRMRLDEEPPPGGPTLRLGQPDLAALRGLYQDGAARGEIPDFFDDAMVRHGIYHGIRDAGQLVAVAGTHVVTGTVAAIGNVYVRRESRGRGLAGRVTSAVAHELGARGIGTIVLNVRQDNAPAIRTYEKLGFVVHGEFVEGFARPQQGG